MTHHGQFEFKVIPFGLTNAPATFQKLMNMVFGEYLRKFVLVFFDDFFIYSPDMETRVVHLRLVLHVLRKHTLYGKLSKCSFALDHIDYLGYIIFEEGVSIDPTKTQAIGDWPFPKSIKSLRGSLSLTGYYRRFIKNYGTIAKPLTQLLKKNGFKWSTEVESAFTHLKEMMIKAPVLALLNFKKPFVLETDASQIGIGVVLMQNKQPIAYFSQAMSEKSSPFYLRKRASRHHDGCG